MSAAHGSPRRWTRLRCGWCRYVAEQPGGVVTGADLDAGCRLCGRPLGAVTVYVWGGGPFAPESDQQPEGRSAAGVVPHSATATAAPVVAHGLRIARPNRPAGQPARTPPTAPARALDDARGPPPKAPGSALADDGAHDGEHDTGKRPPAAAGVGPGGGVGGVGGVATVSLASMGPRLLGRGGLLPGCSLRCRYGLLRWGRGPTAAEGRRYRRAPRRSRRLRCGRCRLRIDNC